MYLFFPNSQRVNSMPYEISCFCLRVLCRSLWKFLGDFDVVELQEPAGYDGVIITFAGEGIQCSEVMLVEARNVFTC
jgi:hypothetical protein